LCKDFYVAAEKLDEASAPQDTQDDEPALRSWNSGSTLAGDEELDEFHRLYNIPINCERSQTVKLEPKHSVTVMMVTPCKNMHFVQRMCGCLAILCTYENYYYQQH